jgi:hypothetical protein
MTQVPYWRPTNITRHSTKFSNHGYLDPSICATLFQAHEYSANILVDFCFFTILGPSHSKQKFIRSTFKNSVRTAQWTDRLGSMCSEPQKLREQNGESVNVRAGDLWSNNWALTTINKKDNTCTRTTQAHSQNHCCRGKTKSTTYSVCICVCSLSYPAHQTHVLYYTVICGLPGSATLFYIIS